jgi:hypothetical protein
LLRILSNLSFAIFAIENSLLSAYILEFTLENDSKIKEWKTILWGGLKKMMMEG